jgi:hypothetical protein
MMVHTAVEAVNFINSLSYRGTAHHNLICNYSTRGMFEDYFNGSASYVPCEVRTTNCSTTYIAVYTAQAYTLEAHNEIVEAKVKTDEVKREAARIAAMNEVNEGTYSVWFQLHMVEGGSRHSDVSVQAYSLQNAIDQAWDIVHARFAASLVAQFVLKDANFIG